MKLGEVLAAARAGDAAILAAIEDGTKRDALAARILRDEPAAASQYSPATLGARLVAELTPERRGQIAIELASTLAGVQALVQLRAFDV